MKMNRLRSRKGATLVEFSMAGIPMIFVLVSAVQMALGMWQYETLAYGIKTGAQSVVSKGKGCSTGTNSCGTTVGAIATTIANSAIGIPASELSVTLTTASGATTTCNPISDCTSNTTAWPPSTNNDNEPGQIISIKGQFTLNSATAMFYPGAKPVSFSAATLSAAASQVLMF
jgi:Flp pilus assembly protein TadG